MVRQAHGSEQSRRPNHPEPTCREPHDRTSRRANQNDQKSKSLAQTELTPEVFISSNSKPETDKGNHQTSLTLRGRFQPVGFKARGLPGRRVGSLKRNLRAGFLLVEHIVHTPRREARGIPNSVQERECNS